MLKAELKKQAVLYGIFFGIVAVVFTILIIFTLLSRSSWKNALAVEMQNVLSIYEKDTYTVNKFIELDSPLSTSAVAFSLVKKGAGLNESYYGIIARIPAIMGSAPAVFVIGGRHPLNSENVKFIGFAEDYGKASALADTRFLSSNISYWNTALPKILERSIEKQGEKVK